MNTHTMCDAGRHRLLVLAGIGTILPGCATEEPVSVAPPQAVGVIELAESDWTQKSRLPGSVVSWQQRPDEDQARFDAALATSFVKYYLIFAEIFDLDMKRWEVELTRRREQLRRLEQAEDSNAKVTEARAAFAAVTANLETLKARRIAWDGELAVLKWKELKSKAAVNHAQLELDGTEHLGPFDARVNKVYATPRAIEVAGTAMANSMAMDPVKVKVTVPVSRGRHIQPHEQVLVHTDSSPEPISAIVYQKSSAATATTDAFTVTLLCRNHHVESFDQPNVDTVPISGFKRPQIFEVDGAPTWFVDEQCVYSSKGGHHGWRVINTGVRSKDEPVNLERIELKLGEARRDLLGIYRFRQLIPDIEMAAAMNEPGTGNGRWPLVLAAGVPTDYAGGKVISTQRWMLRPGDIIDVQLGDEAPLPGMYVPGKYIRIEGDQHFVFMVDELGGKLTARKVPVDIVGSVGDLRCIDGPDIQTGRRMITNGMHYLRDGAEIELTL